MLRTAREFLSIVYKISAAYLHFRFARGAEIHNLTEEERKILKVLIQDLGFIA